MQVSKQQLELDMEQQTPTVRVKGPVPSGVGGTGWRLVARLGATARCVVLGIKNLFTFGCDASSLLCRLFSSCGEWGLLSHCGLLIVVASLAVEHGL